MSLLVLKFRSFPTLYWPLPFSCLCSREAFRSSCPLWILRTFNNSLSGILSSSLLLGAVTLRLAAWRRLVLFPLPVFLCWNLHIRSLDFWGNVNMILVFMCCLCFVKTKICYKLNSLKVFCPFILTCVKIVIFYIFGLPDESEYIHIYEFWWYSKSMIKACSYNLGTLNFLKPIKMILLDLLFHKTLKYYVFNAMCKMTFNGVTR